jgi:hypothetical protein
MSGKGEDLPEITPETRLAALLDALPELEKTLYGLSPAYAKLKNPVLRKTVGRVATLRQVARVGNVPLGRLINTLRAAAGMEETAEADGNGNQGEDSPGWVASGKVKIMLDARPLIEQGEHPMARVLKELPGLVPGELFELVTPFLPAPLIDMAREKGYRAWSENVGQDQYRTLFGAAGK